MLCWVTVRLPVTPTASAGTLVVTSRGWRPVTWKEAATWLWIFPVMPRLLLVSSTRFGVRGT